MKSMKNVKDIRVRAKEASKKTDEILKEMHKQKCIWPGCKEKQFMTVSLQLMEQTAEGQLKPKGDQESSQGIGAPFCNYHFAIASCGLCVAVEQPGAKPGQFGLLAPMDMVQAAEAVVSGLVFSGRLQELLKTKNEVDTKKNGGETNEHKPNTDKKEGDQPSDNNRDEQCSEGEQGKGGDPKPQDN